MKKSPVYIAISVALLCLFLGYQKHLRRVQEKEKQEEPSIEERNDSGANTLSPPGQPAGPPSSPWTWADLSDTTYSEYIAGLRVVKCPEPTITSLVIGDVNKVYRHHLYDLRLRFKTTNQVAYWSATSRGKGLSAVALWRQIEESMNVQRIAAVKQYITTELPPEALQALRLDISVEEDAFGGGLSFLPSEQAARVRTGLDSIQANLRRISATGVNGQELLDEMDKQQRGLYKELSGQVSPEQLLQIKARTSSTSERLREELAYLEPSEDEYLRIFQEFDKAAEQFPDKTVANEMARQKIKQMLSPERYAEFERSRSTAFQSIAGFFEGNGMQLDSAAALYRIYLEMASDSAQGPSAFGQNLFGYQQRAQEILGDNYGRFANSPKGAWLTGSTVPKDSSTVRYGVVLPPP